MAGKKGDFKNGVKFYKEISQNEARLIQFAESDATNAEKMLNLLHLGLRSVDEETAQWCCRVLAVIMYSLLASSQGDLS